MSPDNAPLIPDPALPPLHASPREPEMRAGKPAPVRRPASRRAVWIWFIAVAIVLALLGAGLYGFNAFKAKAMADYFAKNKPPPPPVSVVSATSGQVPSYITAIGSLTAVRQVRISSEVGGRITQIMFKPGSEVKAGAPLVQLYDQPDRADLASYQAQARLQQANLGRAQILLQRQFVAQANVDQLRSQLDTAGAGIARANAVIAQKLIKAPFDGQLGIRQVEVGQYVNPGDPVVTLTNLATLYVNFTAPEQTAAQLQVGQSVQFGVDAYRGRSFAAKITTIEPQVAADTRLIKVQGTLENPDRILLPGMFADVRVVLPAQPPVVLVPETAVDFTLYGDSVFVVREEGQADGKAGYKAVRTAVKTGTRFGDQVAIVSGLSAGDKVVNAGQLRLQDGMAVTLAQSDTLTVPAKPPIN